MNELVFIVWLNTLDDLSYDLLSKSVILLFLVWGFMTSFILKLLHRSSIGLLVSLLACNISNKFLFFFSNSSFACFKKLFSWIIVIISLSALLPDFKLSAILRVLFGVLLYFLLLFFLITFISKFSTFFFVSLFLLLFSIFFKILSADISIFSIMLFLVLKFIFFKRLLW